MVFNYFKDNFFDNKSYFNQADVNVSILDYLGLPIATNNYGRSFFRVYNKERELLFASTYANRIYYHNRAVLTSCTYDFKCQAHMSAPFLDGNRVKTKLLTSTVNRVNTLVKLANNRHYKNKQLHKLLEVRSGIVGMLRLSMHIKCKFNQERASPGR